MIRLWSGHASPNVHADGCVATDKFGIVREGGNKIVGDYWKLCYDSEKDTVPNGRRAATIAMS